MPTRKSHLSPNLFQGFLHKVRSLDLAPIAYQLIQANTGPKWTREQAIQAIARYLAFLYLIARYPNLPLVPTQEIDQVWHQHILDTQKYAEDCQKLFGRFIHHFPYLGTRGQADQRKLLQSHALTQVLFRKHFGENWAIDAQIQPSDCEPLYGEQLKSSSEASSNIMGCAALIDRVQERPRVEISTEETLRLFPQSPKVQISE